MPIYEYRCESCGKVFEAIRRVGQGTAELACPACGAERLVQLLSTFAAHSHSGGGGGGCGQSSGSCGGGGGG